MRTRHFFTGILSIIMAWVILASPPAMADLDVIREVVITPKTGRAGANIGQVNSAEAISMDAAEVDIQIGPVPPAFVPLDIHVKGSFIMANQTNSTVDLTVGFPLSSSRYVAFDLRHFTAVTDGSPRAVCRRVTGYPRHLRLEKISGPTDQSCEGLPDYEDTPPGQARHLYGREHIGRYTAQHMMVWRETFAPRQTKVIRVAYAIAIPLQPFTFEVKRVRGNYKNTWPQEANNTPIEFLARLEKGEPYYFFEYVLTSGGSWAGPIGEETVSLRLDPSWSGHTLHRSHGPAVTERFRHDDAGPVYDYYLRATDPTYNLRFALSRP